MRITLIFQSSTANFCLQDWPCICRADVGPLYGLIPVFIYLRIVNCLVNGLHFLVCCFSKWFSWRVCYFYSSEQNQYKLCFPARKRWGKEKSIKYYVNKVSSRNVHYWSTGTHELVDWCLYELKCFNSKNSHQRWSIKKLFWKVSQYLHEPSVLKSLFLKFINKRLQLRCFPVNIMKFLRTPFLKNICERLLLPFESSHCLLRVLHSIFL